MNRIYILFLLLVFSSIAVNPSFGQACPTTPTIAAATVGVDSVTINWTLDCSGAACANGVVYYVGVYGQESEPGFGLNAEYGFGTYLGPGCDFTSMWDGNGDYGNPGTTIDPKASTCVGTLMGGSASMFSTSFDAAFDKDFLCGTGGTMSTAFHLSEFCSGVTYDIRIYEIALPVGPGGASSASDIACLTDIVSESEPLELINAFTTPGVLTGIPSSTIDVSGDIVGSFSGCGNSVDILCTDEIDVDITMIGGCKDNSIAGYIMINPTVACGAFASFVDVGSALNEWDFVFGDNFVDGFGNPVPKIFANGANPLEGMIFTDTTEICMFTQDMCNGSFSVSCVTFNTPVPKLEVVDIVKNQGVCFPDPNDFTLTVAGGSGGPYNYTYDNNAGTSGTGVAGASTDLGNTGGLFTIVISDAGPPPNACDTTIYIDFVSTFPPVILPNPYKVSVCEGNVASIPLTMYKTESNNYTITNSAPAFLGFGNFCSNGAAPTSDEQFWDFPILQNPDNPDASNDLCTSSLTTNSVTQVCVNITIDNPDRVFISIDFDLFGVDPWEELYIGNDWLDDTGGNGSGNPAVTGPGTYNLCFNSGAPQGDFDGVFDGGSNGPWTGLDPTAASFTIWVGDSYCRNPGAGNPVSVNSASITFFDPCTNTFVTDFGAPTATWTPQGGNPPLAPTMNITGTNGDLAEVTTAAGSAGSTYNYDIAGVDENGCPTSTIVEIEVIPPLPTAPDFPLNAEYCVDEPDEVITPNLPTAQGTRGGIYIAIYTDIYPNETTFSLFDLNNNLIISDAAFGILNPEQLYVLFNNECVDLTTGAGVPGRLEIYDSFGDGIYDPGGAYVYYHAADGWELVSSDNEGNGYQHIVPSAGLPPTMTAASNVNNNPWAAASIAVSIPPPSSWAYWNYGTWSGGATDNGTITHSWFNATVLQQDIVLPNGDGLFSPSSNPVTCGATSAEQLELIYTFNTNVGHFGPSPCGCEADATKYTNIREKVIIDDELIVSCSVDGGLIYSLVTSDISGASVGYEMNVEGGGWVPLEPISVPAGSPGVAVQVRSDDGCGNNPCEEATILQPSIPIPQIFGVTDNSCGGGGAPFTIDVTGSVSCGGCVVEYSFDGGAFSTTSSIGGIALNQTVVIEVRTNDGGTFNVCPNPVSDYTIGECPIILAMELESLEGYNLKADNVLNWSTSEKGLRKFEVFRQENGSELKFLGAVNAFENSAETVHDYSYTEIDAPTGVSLYKIGAVYLDGSVEYSDFVRINKEGAGNELNLISVVPSPFENYFDINFSMGSESDLSIQLFDLSGKEIFSKIHGVKSTGVGTIHVELPEIAPGMYMLNLSSSNSKVSQKIIRY